MQERNKTGSRPAATIHNDDDDDDDANFWNIVAFSVLEESVYCSM